jgi:hypothetical protein
MALNVKALKEEMENTCPLFVDREKGNWEDIEGQIVHVDGATMYTDSNGDTYGVITVQETPGAFYLCGSIATKIVEKTCNPDNGGTFDENGIMTEIFAIEVGEMLTSKKDKTHTYRSIKLIVE